MKPRWIIGLIVLAILSVSGGLWIVKNYGDDSEIGRQRATAAKTAKEDQEKREVQEKIEGARHVRQYLADKLVGGLIYFKDQRTGICYAYGLGEYDDPRSAIFTQVPEGSIPPEMLTVANVGEKK